MYKKIEKKLLKSSRSAIKSLQRLALESLRRLLLKWPTLLLTAQAVPLLKRFWNPLVWPMQSASTSLKRPVGLVHRRMIKVMVKISSTVLLLSKLCNFRLPEIPNNPCDSIRMLNVNEGIVYVDNKSKILQKSSVMQIQNVRFTPSPSQVTRTPRPTWDSRPAYPKMRDPRSISFKK